MVFKQLKKLYVTLNIERKYIKFQMDTGASCNVMPIDTLRKTNYNRRKIKPTDIILKTYNGNSLNVIGKCILKCEGQGK